MEMKQSVKEIILNQVTYTITINQIQDNCEHIYCHSYIAFTITNGEWEISGKLYDDEDYLSIYENPLEINGLNFKDFKEVLYQTFNISDLWYYIDDECIYCWCFEPNFNEKGIWSNIGDSKTKIYNHYDVLRYEGGVFNGKLHGYGKLFDQDGRLEYEGQFIHGEKAE